MNIPPEVARAQGHHGIKGASHGIKGGRPRLPLTVEERKERRRIQKEVYRHRKGCGPLLGPKLPKFEAEYFAVWGKLYGQPLTPEEFALREPIWNARILAQQDPANPSEPQRRKGRTKRRTNKADQPPPSKEKKSPRVGRNDPCPCGSGRKFKKCCGP